MKYFTTKELSKISGERINTITRRVGRLKIKGIFLGDKQVYFTKHQALRILNEHKKYSIKNNPDKIKIVEMYFSRCGIKNIPDIVNVTKNAVEMCLKEFKETGCVTVESSLNLKKIEL